MKFFEKGNKKVSFEEKDPKTILYKNLEFSAREQYNLLRTNLEFTAPKDEKCFVVGVTSSVSKEGKSITSINLSLALAEKGNRVLLVDGDLRIPSIAKKLQLHHSLGLTDMLMGKNIDFSSLQSEHSENLFVLTSGYIPPNPSELLGSNRMEAVLEQFKEQFDYVIIDLPPINIVSDALSLSPMISGMVVVVREGYTGKRELDKCIKQLEFSGANILGFVMNAEKYRGGIYNRYYRKYKRYEDYGDCPSDKNNT